MRTAVLARRLAVQQLNLANTSEGQLTLETAPIIPTPCAGHKSYHGPLLGTQRTLPYVLSTHEGKSWSAGFGRSSCASGCLVLECCAT